MVKVLKVIINDDGKITVGFTGPWIRKDIDRASFAALRELPKHIASRKAKLNQGDKT